MSANLVVMLMGTYLIGGGLLMLISPSRLTAMIDNMGDQPALAYVAGAIMAPLGAAVLYWFHDFESWQNGISTIIGAGLLLEGWMLMIVPELIIAMARPFMVGEKLIRVAGVPVLAAATLALWYGWTA